MSSPIDTSVKITKPFSSDTDKDKQDLMLDADLYRDKLELQWNDLKTDATQYSKQAMIIGGVLVTSFILLKAVLPKGKKHKNSEEDYLFGEEKKKYHKKKSKFAVGQAVQSLAWTLAVGWARQKLKHVIADERKTE